MYGALLMSFVFFTYSVHAVPRFFQECTSKENADKFINCAALRVLKTVERAESQKFFELVPGITLERNESSARSGKELPLDLPTNSTNQTLNFFDILLASTARFISGRTLKIEIPLKGTNNVARAFEEGRGKMKKMMGPLLLGLGTKMMSMVPIMFGGVLLLVSKALIVGKLAFVLSAILFIQSFFSGRQFSSNGGSFGAGIPPPTYGVPTTFSTNWGTNYHGTNSIGGGWGTSAQYPYARSIDVEQKEEDTQRNI